jgi:hypothetical protein
MWIIFLNSRKVHEFSIPFITKPPPKTFLSKPAI